MKVLIAGAGKIGAYMAYSLLKNKAVTELVVVSRNLYATTGLCQDLQDAYPAAKISPMPLEQVKGNIDLTLLCFSTLQWRPDIGVNDRLIEAESNIAILKEMGQKIDFSCLGNIIVISNPVDILTTYINRCFGLLPVIGFGLALDEKRLARAFQKLSGTKLPYISCIGEHGSSVVPMLSHVSGQNVYEDWTYKKVKAMAFEHTALIMSQYAIPLFGPLSEIETLTHAFVSKSNGVVSASYFLEKPLWGIEHLAIGLPVVIREGLIAGYQVPAVTTMEREMFLESAGHIEAQYRAVCHNVV